MNNIRVTEEDFAGSLILSKTSFSLIGSNTNKSKIRITKSRRKN
jgi:hypothetical protein